MCFENLSACDLIGLSSSLSILISQDLSTDATKRAIENSNSNNSTKC